MKLSEIISTIENLYPLELAAKWDNSGLQAGRRDKEISHIYVCLDPSLKEIRRACEIGADLMVSHHPLIFGSIDSVTDDDPVKERVLTAVENGLCVYSSHTCYDAVTMTDAVFSVLGLRADNKDCEILDEEEGIGRIYLLDCLMSAGEIAAQVKQALGLPDVRMFSDPDAAIKKVAIVPGAGKSLISTAINKGCDLLITGDLDHHSGLDAREADLSVLDCGHYGLEYVFIHDMAMRLEGRLSNIRVTEAKTEYPYSVI